MSNYAIKSRVLIVGEGRETEYNYFVGFRNAFEDELEAAAIAVSVARGKGGDARRIVNNAIHEAKKFAPDRKRGDRVFLLLDTEGPRRATELPDAESLAAKHGIEIVYSCPSFEYWLLCHFKKVSRRYFKNCDAVIEEMNRKWNQVCKTFYDKADKDVFERLSEKLETARTQALEIDLLSRSLRDSALRVNPSTQVYELVACLIGARSGERCPISGEWKLVADPTVAIRLEKGEVIPNHGDQQANWRIGFLKPSNTHPK